jgi:hypothetical protein
MAVSPGSSTCYQPTTVEQLRTSWLRATQGLGESGIGSMIPGSLSSGELTLALISQIRIRSAGKGFSNAFKLA